MKKFYLAWFVVSFFYCNSSIAQLVLTNASPSATIDFSNTMQTTVGSNPGTAYTAAGFSSAPTTAGRLNSEAWATTGWSDGALAFSGTNTSGDHARGATAVAVTTGGMYAYTATPQSVANPCLMIQPGGSDFAPGTLTLRIKNNGTTNITQLIVSYNLFVRNDQARSTSFNFSSSPDNSTYTPVTALNYTTTVAADALGWVQVGTSPSRTTTITGLSVAPGAYYYIRWSSDDVAGSGSRDEIGLDDISVAATYAIPCTAPANQATNISFSSITVNSSHISWTAPVGGADGYVLVVRTTNNTFSNLTDGTSLPSAGSAPWTDDKIVYVGTNAFFDISGLTASTTYYFKVYAYKACAGPNYAFNNSTATNNPNSVLTSSANVVAGTLASFGNRCIAGTYNSSFTVSGTVLDGTKLTVGALTGFTYSLNSGGPYTSTLDVPYTAPTLTTTTVYVQFSPVTVTSYNGSISVTDNGSGGAKTVAAVGAGVNTTPTETTSGASSIGLTTATLGGSITAIGCSNATVRGFEWSTTNGFANGTGTQVSESGTFGIAAFTLNVTALPSGTIIYYKTFATNSGGTSYSTQASFSTLQIEPTNHVTGFTCMTPTASSIPLKWTDATTGTAIPDGYLILWSDVSYAAITDPVDGTPVANGANAQNISQGTAAFTPAPLTQTTTYYFKIYPYTNSGANINYKINGTVPQTSCTTVTTPCEYADFEGGDPTNWTVSATNAYLSNSNASLAYAGSWRSGISGTNGWISLPQLTNASSLSFWCRASSNTSAYTVRVQYSTSTTGPWTDGATYVANGTNNGDITDTYQQKTVSLGLGGAYSYYVRWIMTANTSGSIYLDEVNVYCAACTTPLAATSFVSTCGNASASLTWANPGCFDQVMIVASSAAFTAALPTGNGSAYTASLTYGSGTLFDGGRVVYKGSGTSSGTITSLINGTTYNYKIYSRIGTSWIAGGTVSCTPNTVTYCAATTTNSGYEFIDRVIFNTIDKSSSGDGKYQDWTALSTQVTRGSTYNLTVYNGNSNFTTDEVKAYIDYNNNGSFADAGERIYTLPLVQSTGPYIYSVTIPATATLGKVRMRIRLEDGSYTTADSCGTAQYGEVEDYTVDIQAACTPSVSISSFLPTSGPVATLVTITGSGFSSATGVYFGTIAATSYTIVSNTSIIAEVPAGISATSKIIVTESGCLATSSGNFTLINKSSCFSVFTDLILSEIFDPQSGNNHYIEIYNGTGVSVNLSNYKLYLSTVGTDLTLSGTINNGAVYIVYAGTDGGLSTAGIGFGSGFNENDYIRLKKNDGSGTFNVIDEVRTPNYVGYTMIRNSTVISPSSTYVAGEWTSTDRSTNLPESTLGSHVATAATTFTITAHPADVLTCGFSMSAAATGATGYQWKFNDPATNTWLNVTATNLLPYVITVTGDNTTTLTLAGADLAGLYNFQFYCQFTNGTCIEASNAAQFTYASLPVYRSKSGGNWSNAGIWEMANAATDPSPWTAACSYPTSINSSEVIIKSGTSVDLDLTALTIDKVTIENTADLEILPTSKLTVLNGDATGPDLIVNGTLIDRGSSSNGLAFGTGVPRWILGTAGNIVKSNSSSVTNYSNYYDGGIATIPDGSGGATWYYRHDGTANTTTGNITVASVGMYYPNLVFESTSGGWNPVGAGQNTSRLTGSTNTIIVKGNLDIGGAGSNGTNNVTVYNENTNANLIRVLGNTIIRSNSALTNAGISSNGAGFDLRGNLTVDGSLTVNGGGAGIVKFLSGATPATQLVSGTGTMNLQDVTISTNAAYGVTLSAGRDMRIPGLLSITSGLLDVQSNTLDGTGNLTMTGGGLSISKNAGSAVMLPELSGIYTLNSGTVTFYGNGTGAANAQLIRPINYYNLTSSSTGDRILSGVPGNVTGIGNVFTAGSNIYTVTGSAVNFFKAGTQTIPGLATTTVTSSPYLNQYNILLTSGSGVKSTAASFTILDSLKIGSGTTFTVSSSNVVTIKSDINKTARVAMVEGTASYGGSGLTQGRFLIERFIPMNAPYTSRRWRLLTAPISDDANAAPSINASWQEGATNTNRLAPVDLNIGYGTTITRSMTSSDGFDQGSTSNPSIYYLNPSAVWTVPAATNTGNITDYPGYMLFVRGDRSIVVSNQYINTTGKALLRVKGKINTGDIPTLLSTTTNQFQVIANPYASAMSFNNVSFGGVAPGITTGKTYYKWDPKLLGSNGVGAWATFSSNGNNTYAIVPKPVDSAYMSAYANTGIIESGEAIIVKSPGSGSFIIHETDKLGTSSNTGIASRPSGVPGQISSLYNNLSYVTSAGVPILADGVATAYADNYHNAVDDQDASKLQSFSLAEKIYLTRDDSLLAIERRQTIKEADTIFYIIDRLRKPATYQFKFLAENFAPSLTAMLEDKYLHSRTVLNIAKGMDMYYFQTTDDSLSTVADRFRIVFTTAIAGPLPVTFKTINAWEQQTDIAVKWTIENEINTREYTIERSADGVNFEKIGTMPFNSNSGGIYNYLDKDAFKGDNFYRIVSIGVDGKVEYSSIVKVNINNKTSQITVYPNPVRNGQIGLQLTNQPKGVYGLRVFNNIGQLIVERTLNYAGGSVNEAIDLGKAAAKGIYHLEVISPSDKKIVLKVINKD